GLEVDPMQLAGQIDWVAKYTLVDAYRERRGLRWDDHKLAAMDLQYHDIRPERSLFARLDTEKLLSEESVVEAITEPPKGTRAYFRGKCLQRWASSIAAANWDSMVFDLGTDPLRRVPMMEPLKGTAAHVHALLEGCARPPLAPPGAGAGPDFAELLRRLRLEPVAVEHADPALQITHGTTIVALRYTEGVVMAGDRRATAGSSIAHRAMEKVYPADRHSGVAIAGAAGFALDMVRLFQLQLEHYEKVEGMALSLEGKANQLAQMVRQNLPSAMQGLVVVPLFAGYDLRRRQGRIFTYDVTGGRYE